MGLLIETVSAAVLAQWQTLGIACECHGSSEMTIINGFPVSQYVWHSKEPSLLYGHTVSLIIATLS